MILRTRLKAVSFALIACTAILERGGAADRIRAGPGQFFYDSDDRVSRIHLLTLIELRIERQKSRCLVFGGHSGLISNWFVLRFAEWGISSCILLDA